MRKYIHSPSVCSNSCTMNKPHDKAENSLPIYDIVIAQRCFLCILIVFSSLLADSWAAHIPRQSEHAESDTSEQGLLSCFTDTDKHLPTHPAGCQNNPYTVIYEIFIVLLKGHSSLSQQLKIISVGSLHTLPWRCPGHP